MTFIKNRKGQKISVVVDSAEGEGVAFIAHGLGGFKEQKQLIAISEAFRENGITAVRFDTTNTFGESDGNYEDATTTNYLEDLEDVIEWASEQEWYKEPFWLAGHSLGSFTIALYSEKYPNKVRGLAPLSTVVSGKLSLESPQYKGNDVLEQWEKTGWRIKESSSYPGRIKKLKWSHIVDRLKYDLLEAADQLRMPILLLAGTEDTSTPEEHQRLLFDAIPHDRKEIHIIDGAPHTFVQANNIEVLKQILKKWVAKYK